MKNLVMAIVIVLLVISQVSAQSEKLILNTELNFGYFSKYISSSARSTVYDDEVFQQSVKFTLDPWGIYIMVWNSFSPKGGPNKDLGDEGDFLAGIYRTFGEFGIGLGYAFYDLVEIGKIESDFHVITLNLDLPMAISIHPYVGLEWDIPTDKQILPGGFLYRAGGRYGLKLPDFLRNQIINLDLSFAGHDGAYDLKSELVSSARLAISTTFDFWKLQIVPEVNFQESFHNNGGIAEDKIWYGISFKIPFDYLK